MLLFVPFKYIEVDIINTIQKLMRQIIDIYQRYKKKKKNNLIFGEILFTVFNKIPMPQITLSN